jgi:hypothetical protein
MNAGGEEARGAYDARPVEVRPELVTDLPRVEAEEMRCVAAPARVDSREDLDWGMRRELHQPQKFTANPQALTAHEGHGGECRSRVAGIHSVFEPVGQIARRTGFKIEAC